ncbi:MAG: nucleotidyl transferase AbiEii/AbiGii toxin family protein [Ignavibacteriae bacterium]|nr:nucleotidyl transferase AbiEii/AbiGii toxin family protein [Ignavibacteriota bacterium]
MISSIEIKQIANEYRFNTANVEKVIRLVNLLDEIYSHPFLKKTLVLKGGTAINIFIFDVPRLSVDIDLNYIGSPEKKVMLEERLSVREFLERIVQLQRYEKVLTENYGSDRFELWYNNVSGNKDRIKVEINYLLRIPLLKPVVSRKQKIFTNVSLPKVSIMAHEELFASKTVALLSRHAARDLYDIYNLSSEKSFMIKKSLLRTCFIFYGIINREDFRTMSIETIDSVSPRDIKRTLYPLLQRELFFDLEKSKQKVKQFILPLFRFTKKEKGFIESFFTGQYMPELLFDPNYFSDELSLHPMIEWKQSHIQKHVSE